MTLKLHLTVASPLAVGILSFSSAEKENITHARIPPKKEISATLQQHYRKYIASAIGAYNFNVSHVVNVHQGRSDPVSGSRFCPSYVSEIS